MNKIKAGDWVQVVTEDEEQYAKVLEIDINGNSVLDRRVWVYEEDKAFLGGFDKRCLIVQDEADHHYTMEGDDFPIVPGEWYEDRFGCKVYCVGKSATLGYVFEGVGVENLEKHELKGMWKGEQMSEEKFLLVKYINHGQKGNCSSCGAVATRDDSKGKEPEFEDWGCWNQEEGCWECHACCLK